MDPQSSRGWRLSNRHGLDRGSVDANTGTQTFRVTLDDMPDGSCSGDIVLHEESLNRGTVIRNCTTFDIGTRNASTLFRCVDVKFQNNKFEDFHFWFHAGPNGPRPRGILLENNWVSDLRIGRMDFQQGLDCATGRGESNRRRKFYRISRGRTNIHRKIIDPCIMDRPSCDSLTY